MPILKRRRLLVTDLDTDAFRKKTVEGVEKVTTAPAFQILAHGTDPNAAETDPLDGKVAYTSNGTNITKTWIHTGTEWISN
jgi:hypothetical protein